VLQSKAEDIW